ncbi:MAG: NAD(P)-binding protein, partial [Verrucomicrobiota bacterium]
MKRRIAILGGGVAGLTAAYELTQPGVSEPVDVTIYQLGWRLGGKCASGRSIETTASGKMVFRSYEHGTHILFGCYENAFHMLEACYRELDRPEGVPLSRWFPEPGHDSAVKPFRNGPGASGVLSMMEGHENPPLEAWDFIMNEAPGKPGDRLSHGIPSPDLWEYFQGLVRFLRDGFYELSTGSKCGGSQWLGDAPDMVKTAWKLLASLGRDIHRLPSFTFELTKAAQGAERERLLTSIGWCLEQLQGRIQRSPESLPEHERHLKITLTIGLAVGIGMIKDQVFRFGLNHIDDFEFTDWIRKHGATDPAVYHSALIRTVYIAPIAFDPQDDHQRALSAAVAVRFLLRLFLDYRGAWLWKMQSGMGEVVVAPLYEVLKKRGVRFQFFHKVEALEAEDDHISRIRIRRQVDLRDPTSEYQPLLDVEGLACWPESPLYDQIHETQAQMLETWETEDHLTLESAWLREPEEWGASFCLESGQDFDEVVLAMSLGGVNLCCQDLLSKRERWRRMAEHVQTIQTMHCQVWTQKGIRELGWEGVDQPFAVSLERPLDSWMDHSHLLHR